MKVYKSRDQKRRLLRRAVNWQNKWSLSCDREVYAHFLRQPGHNEPERPDNVMFGLKILNGHQGVITFRVAQSGQRARWDIRSCRIRYEATSCDLPIQT